MTKIGKSQEILYEDDALLVCRKAAGTAVQSRRVGEEDLVSLLKNELALRRNGVPYLGIVHRLDQPVEGLLVFAKDPRTAAALSKQVSDGTMSKRYLAVCCAQELPAAREGTLVGELKKDGRTNTSALVPPGTPGAKRAELRYRIVGERCLEERWYLLAQVELVTGRHHQIRVQMAGASLALYGDRKYNARWEEFCRPECGEPGRTELALCAASLGFVHPQRKKRMHFETKPSAGIFGLF